MGKSMGWCARKRLLKVWIRWKWHASQYVVYRDTKKKTTYALRMHAFNWLQIDGNRVLLERSSYEAASPGLGYINDSGTRDREQYEIETLGVE